MNCDEAFEHLTDPELRDRPELRWHLEMCSRCRQMKDILDPALPLIDNNNAAQKEEELEEEEELSFPEFEESYDESFLESDYSDIFGSESEFDTDKEPSPFSAWDMVHLANQSARRRDPHSYESPELEETLEPPNNWIRYVGFFLLGGAIMYGLFAVGLPKRETLRTPKDYCLWLHPELIKNYTDIQSSTRSCINCHERYPNNSRNNYRQREQNRMNNWRE